MPERNVDIIISTRVSGESPGKVAAALNDLKSEVKEVDGALKKTQSSSGGLNKSLGELGGGAGGLKGVLGELKGQIPLMEIATLGGAVMAAGKLAKDSINDYTAYVDQIAKMATYTNTTTEEMSKLYQVTDDLRIPTNNLEMALKTMAEKGTAPSISGLAELSDKYLGLQDPLARAQFLTDNFGRSGQEMAKMMELGSAKIMEQSDAIADWMIVSGKSKEQVDQYLKTMDAWDESIMRVKYNIASNLVPAISGFLQASMNSRDEIEKNRVKWLDWIPAVRGAMEIYQGLKSLLSGKFAAPPAMPSANTQSTLQTYEKMIASNYGTIYTQNRPGVKYGYLGNRAEGGEVLPGNVYKVGEREVEYLSVGAPGLVTPISGGNVTVNITYAPFMSTLDRAEAVDRLKPLIYEAIRQR